MDGELAEISAQALQEPAACCSKQHNSLHVINSRDQEPALFLFFCLFVFSLFCFVLYSR